MPGGDGTGPLGQGPRTGRGMGFCSGYNTPGFMNQGFRRGFGRGFGAGFRWRAGVAVPQQFQNTQTIGNESEKELIEQELNELREEIKKLETRLEELKN